MKWVVVALFAVILGVFWFLRARSQYLLEVDICTADGQKYSVAFRELVAAAQPIDYVWLCLLFPAKALLIMGHSAIHATDKALLLALLKSLGEIDLARTGNLARALQRPIEVGRSGGAQTRGKRIKAKVRFRNIMSRTIWTAIPLNGVAMQYSHTFIAVVQECLPKLDVVLLQRLQGAFAKMAELYASGDWDPESCRSLSNVPQIALFDARVIA